ncbi:MAG: RIP metalloprotease RseP [Bacillota bacterium]|nr:RIP metalloprotease RseP [Bacillota bacterium]
MTTFWAALFVFGLLIFFHELGHFLAAKRAGIKVEEFAIFMGPKVFSRKVGETLYTIRLLPLGGYCKMAGMEGDSNDDRGFNSKSVPQRMAVIAAGSFMNFFLAILLFSFIFGVIGIPDNNPTTVVNNVILNMPAAEAGLQSGDKIVAINDQKVTEWQQLVTVINQSPEQEIKLTINRDDINMDIYVTPMLDPDRGVGLIGIEPQTGWQRIGLLNAIVIATKQTVQFTALILQSLYLMVTMQMAADVAGPVGIVQEIGNQARVGLPYLLNLAAIISINLGIFNLLPIPALDGSRLVFLFIEAIRRKPLDPEKENFVHLIGFALLLLLVIVVTYKDISRIFG